MKTSTLLSRPLLVALLAVSWVAAAPLQVAPGNDSLKEELEGFFIKNPAIARDLFPDLVDEASTVDLTVDQDVVVDLLNDYVRKLTVQVIEDELEREAESEENQDYGRWERDTGIAGGVQEIESEEEHHEQDQDYERKKGEDTVVQEIESEEEHHEQDQDNERKKRDTGISGGIHTSSNPFGRSIGGSATVNHSWDNGRHSLSGTIGGTKHTIQGLGSANSYSGGVGYNFSPNKKTSIGISAHKNWTPSGSSHGFGLNFSHKFGR